MEIKIREYKDKEIKEIRNDVIVNPYWSNKDKIFNEIINMNNQIYELEENLDLYLKLFNSYYKNVDTKTMNSLYNTLTKVKNEKDAYKALDKIEKTILKESELTHEYDFNLTFTAFIKSTIDNYIDRLLNKINIEDKIKIIESDIDLSDFYNKLSNGNESVKNYLNRYFKYLLYRSIYETENKKCKECINSQSCKLLKYKKDLSELKYIKLAYMIGNKPIIIDCEGENNPYMVAENAFCSNKSLAYKQSKFHDKLYK